MSAGMPNERITLKGSGRGEAQLHLVNGFDIIPKNGRRIIGVFTSALETYVESRTEPGVFYYDSTLSGRFYEFAGLKGIYDDQAHTINWNNEEISALSSAMIVSVLSEEISVAAQPMTSLVSVDESYPASYESYVSVMQSVNPYASQPANMLQSANVSPLYSVQYTPAIQRNRVGTPARQIRLQPVSVVKSRNERKLALDKDI